MANANDELVDTLVTLAQLDIDAIHAYSQALGHIEIKTIYDALMKFQDDHRRHVTELSAEIQKLGRMPPVSRDVKGFFITGFTAIQSLMGTNGALKAMEGNEELTTKTYREALEKNLLMPIKELIEKNFLDEQRHLQFIQQALKDTEKPENQSLV